MTINDALDWPESDLEHLGRCPLCGSSERIDLYTDVRDHVFGVPGAWTIRGCSTCEAAYLDPRPTVQSIGRAYATYYTHGDEAAAASGQASAARKGIGNAVVELRDRLYMATLWPDHSIGGRLLSPTLNRMFPRPTAAIATKLRHLKPARVKGERLLDVGCGNGEFLPVAERLGYRASGIDPDPAAVADAVAHGLDVREASLDDAGLPRGAYTQVMLSHVLEHFHDPDRALSAVHDLLAPGGRLWILQPNLGAQGLKEFGADWRGLEVPRHMVLMKPDRLVRLLREHGFEDPEVHRTPYEARFYFQQSLAIRAARTGSTQGEGTWNPAWEERARDADQTSFANPILCESMTVTATRPTIKPKR